MYGSKYMSDPEDDYPYEEIIISGALPPEPLPRKKGKKGKGKCCQQSIEDEEPYSSEEIERAKPRKTGFKTFSILKDAKEKKPKRKRKDERNEETYNADNEYSGPDCSIIYSNPFDEEDRMTAEFPPRMGCAGKRKQEKEDWIESDSSLYDFSEEEKQLEPEGYNSTFDSEDDKSEKFLADIPSIPEGDLFEAVEIKPEPEVLATALLMSETEDLQNTRPDEIFDKLFSDTASSWTYVSGSRAAAGLETTARLDETGSRMTGASKSTRRLEETDSRMTGASESTRRLEATDSMAAETTRAIDSLLAEKAKLNGPTMEEETSSTAFRDSQQEQITPAMKWASVETMGDLTLSTVREDKTRGERTEDDDTLEYTMKAEVAAAASPAYRNYVRLNGSVKPSWFAGYALVSPLLPDCIRITSDPGEALLEAWRLCRPRHFDEFSKSFLNTA